MTPYYEDGTVTIWHGDCREIMSDVSADVCVTDPPYGIGLDTNYRRITRSSVKARAFSKHAGLRHRPIQGDDEPFDPTFLLVRPAALLGADHYHQLLPAGGTWHCWDKREHLGSNMFADFETWWTSYPSGPSRLFRYMWLGFMRAGESGPVKHLHPTQKPVALMRHIIDAAPKGTIIDPFMGSGSTLRAAKDLGRKAIGIEVDERYCEIAARRMGQEVLGLGA